VFFDAEDQLRPKYGQLHAFDGMVFPMSAMVLLPDLDGRRLTYPAKLSVL
jgi:hypothetical protein